MAEWDPKPVIVGFAAETEDLLANAAGKLSTKGWDLAVANDVTAAGAGFATDTNRVTILDAEGGSEALELMSKADVAESILDRIEQLMSK